MSAGEPPPTLPDGLPPVARAVRLGGGDGVVVSTSGRGERFGESSLPFAQLASRLYIFHVDPSMPGDPQAVPDTEVAEVVDRVHRTWGAERRAVDQLQAQPHPDDGPLGG